MIFQNAELYNVEELVEDQERSGYRLLRLPQSVIEGLNSNAKRTVYYSCGCEIRFNLHSEEAVIYLSRDPNGPDIMPYGIAEVWQGDYQGRYQLSPQPVGQQRTAIRIRKMDMSEFKLYEDHKQQRFDPLLYRVFVPYDWGTRIHSIEGDISLPKPDQIPDETLLAYGSSITHGGGASIPTSSYAFRLAEKLGMDLRNLGLAGSAYMDGVMADYICKQEWSIATLEMGINVLHWTLEEFEEKSRLFISKIVSAHPDKPIYCISPFMSMADYNRTEHMKGMRTILERIVKELDMPKLYYVDGSTCLSKLSGLTSDGIHPSNSGMEEIAQNLYRQINMNSLTKTE